MDMEALKQYLGPRFRIQENKTYRLDPRYVFEVASAAGQTYELHALSLKGDMYSLYDPDRRLWLDYSRSFDTPRCAISTDTRPKKQLIAYVGATFEQLQIKVKTKLEPPT